MLHIEKMAQAAKYKQPCLDYPYLGIPDEDEDEILKELQEITTAT